MALRCTIWAILLVLAALAGFATDKPVVSRSPLSEEQLSVYRGFLDKFAPLNLKELSSGTIPFDFTGFSETRPCLKGFDLESPTSAMSTVHTFGNEITQGRDLRLISLSQMSKMVEDPSLWPADKSRSILVLSEIVFDTTHRFAVLKYELVCGHHCGSGATLIMEKVNGVWTTSARRPCALFVGI